MECLRDLVKIQKKHVNGLTYIYMHILTLDNLQFTFQKNYLIFKSKKGNCTKSFFYRYSSENLRVFSNIKIENVQNNVFYMQKNSI